MAKANSNGDSTQTPLTEKQKLLDLYDTFNELLALQLFYFEAMEGITLHHHYPKPLRHGQCLITAWIKDQGFEFQQRLKGFGGVERRTDKTLRG